MAVNDSTLTKPTLASEGTVDTPALYDAKFDAAIQRINDLCNETTTKGDLLAANSSGQLARLAAGTNAFVLTADSSATLGVKWAASGSSVFVNVKDQGAAGDGTTDDAAAITAALTAASDVHVYFPAGTYLVGSTLVKSVGRLHITAAPGAIVKIKSTYTTGSLFDLNDVTTVIIEGLAIDGNNTALGKTDWTNYIHAIDVHGATEMVRIENCRIYDYPSCAIAADNCSDVHVRDCLIQDGIYHGIGLDTCTSVLVEGNHFIGQGDVGETTTIGGIGCLVTKGSYAVIRDNVFSQCSDTASKAEGCSYVLYDGNEVIDYGKDGLKVQDYTGIATVYFAKFVNNTVRNQHHYRTDGNAGILVTAAEKVVVANNLIEGGVKESGTEDGIRVTVTAAKVIVANNYVGTLVAGSTGIRVYQSTDVSVTGNYTLWPIVAGTVTGTILIEDNVVEAAAASSTLAGVSLSDFTRARISGNLIGNWLYGAYVQPTGRNVESLAITGNTISNCYNRAVKVEQSSAAARTVKLLDCSGNTIYLVAQGAAVTGAIELVNTDTTVSNFLVRNNSLYNAGGSGASYLFYVSGAGPAVGYVDLTGNRHEGIAGLCWPDNITRFVGLSRAAAPAAGTWVKGDLVYNNDPDATEYIGWVCVSAGTPGTWKGFGAIQA